MMKKSFHIGNRERFYRKMDPASVLVLFAGVEIRKSADDFYPFYANRNFVYMTGIEQKNSVFVALKDAAGRISETLYILPSDAHLERWTGKRLTEAEAEEISGVSDIRRLPALDTDLHKLMNGSFAEKIYLDVQKVQAEDIDRPSHLYLKKVRELYPAMAIGNANLLIRELRTIKQPCEIEAVRKAEEITREGILGMMKISRPGLYEYQYKAEFDRILGQYGPQGPGFPSIISAGKNNFCIHYYSYMGQAQDGDIILNDVGAQWDNHTTDVSRGFPCNGKFSPRHKLLHECALTTSNHMFEIVRPGMKMAEVDATIRRYNAQLLVEAGALKSVEEVGKLMWHGGAHHVGYDVHDEILLPQTLAPGMVFCIDVGIYHEEWGIGFRLEDNLLVTEDGCENLSAAIPRTVEDIENAMS